MSTLLLRLAAPLQSWGDSSRFQRRETRHHPTKSGVIGMLAAATGRHRTDSIADLAQLRFGVRVDQPGRLERDFQTARPRGAKNSGLSYRYYLTDAAFVAGVEGDRELLLSLEQALAAPAFPLFLGRRSCPPARAVSLGVVDRDLVGALRECEWQASSWFRRTVSRDFACRIVVDAVVAEQGSLPVLSRDTARDVPVSYDSHRREYVWRDVVELPGQVMSNPAGRVMDFFDAVAEA